MAAFGLDPAQVSKAGRRPEDVLAFIELNIEQGPILEAEGLPVGIVTSIAGATRFFVHLRGKAGHAGTVPMNLRHDAAAAAAEMVLFIERRCHGIGTLVGTVGQLTVPQGATNVIPGAAEFSIDVRAGGNEVREAAVADIVAEVRGIGRRRSVEVEITKTHEAASVVCAPWLMDQIRDAVVAAGVEPRHLSSGAGHDAMAFVDLTDMAMIFSRCGNGGISHHPDEIMMVEDADLATSVLLDVIRNFNPKQYV